MGRSEAAPSATDVLVALVDEAYDRRSWHGPNLRSSLRGVSPELARWHLGKNRHSIWELTAHAAYWKYVVRWRIRGEKRVRFPLVGSHFFPLPEPADAAAWTDCKRLLAEERVQLRGAVASLEERELTRTLGKDDTVGSLVRGAAAHDLYHAGQIRLIRRLHEH
tara:strand:+ start:180 stop:671 length:492 start_codon:yes stop_codon:yes gene_type:complete